MKKYIDLKVVIYLSCNVVYLSCLAKPLLNVGGMSEVWKQAGDASQRLQCWSTQQCKLGEHHLAAYQPG